MKIIRKYILLSVLPIVSFYLMEFYEHNPFTEVRGWAQFFNIILFEGLAWGLYLIIGKAHLALTIEIILACVFGLINHYVMEFRSTPFVPWDLYSTRTALSVVGNYEFQIEKTVILVTIGFFVLLFVTQFAKTDRNPKLVKRLPFALILVGCLGLFVSRLQDEDFQIKHNLYPYLFTPDYMTKVNGIAATFTINLQYLMVEKPADYDVAECEELLKKYETSDTENTNLPNMIVIMDEAFADLQVLGDFETNQDYMPFIRNLRKGEENVVSGMVQVSICGGNTANSEFEFLTANTMEFLPNGSIPYQQYIKKETPSIASHLKDLGYETYAQHPYYKTGWCRDKVYPWLGFEHTAFVEDYKGRRMLRNYVTDASDFKFLIRTFEERDKKKPFFLFNVTMQNHGGYTKTYKNFTNDVQANCDSEALNQYLTLIKKTDESVEMLINYFKDCKEPVLVVFFGDHQPNDFLVRPIWKKNGVDDKNLTGEQKALRYQVPYFIWANYDIKEETGKNLKLNELGTLVLQTAGIPLDAYRNFMVEEKIENTPYEQGSIYQKMQYYMLFDYEEQ